MCNQSYRYFNRQIQIWTKSKSGGCGMAHVVSKVRKKLEREIFKKVNSEAFYVSDAPLPRAQQRKPAIKDHCRNHTTMG